MDQLAEYRRLQAEKRRNKESQNNNNVEQPSSAPTPIKEPATKKKLPDVGPTLDTTTKISAKLVLKTAEEVLRDRQEEVADVLEMSKDTSEKVKYKKKLAEMEQENVKRDRLEKQQAIERMRAEFGKKDALTKPIKYYTSEEAASIVNKSPINTNPNVNDREPDTIFGIEDEEPLTPTSKPCIVQVRLLDGTNVKAKFQSEDKLSVVTNYIIQHITQQREEKRKKKEQVNEEEYTAYDDGIRLSVMFPRKKFDNRTLDTTTIEQAGLFPQGSVAVERDDSAHGFKRKEDEPFKAYVPIDYLEAVAPWRLKGDSHEEKEKFRSKMRVKEIQEKEREKKEKKKELEKIRIQMEDDKRLREEKKRKKSPNDNEPSPKHMSTSPKNLDETSSCLLQVRLREGATMQVSSLVAGDTLQKLRETLLHEGKIDHDDQFTFVVPFPRAEYERATFKRVRLLDIGLAPKGIVVVQFKKTE
jgi:hypothetical protein